MRLFNPWILIALLLTLGGSLMLGELGFQKVLDFRTLERIPLTRISDTVGGEVQLQVRASSAGSLLTAPKTGESTLYYRYRIEERVSDSEGKKRWKTIHSESRVVDFSAVDDSGEALIEAAAGQSSVDWSVRRTFQVREGDLRYTEWRIDPGDAVTIFGWMDLTPVPRVGFTQPGKYLPIVSTYGDQSEREGMGIAALLLLWGSVTLMIGASVLLVYGLSIHKTLTYLVIVTMSCTALLLSYGLRSLERDVAAGRERVDLHLARAERLIDERLAAVGSGFPGWDAALPKTSGIGPEALAQIDAWRVGASVIRARYLDQMARFPERWYAAASGASRIVDVNLPEQLAVRARQQLATYERTRVSGNRFLVVIGLILALALAWLAFREIRTKRLQENVPTSKSTGVSYGIAEVKGALVPQDTDDMLAGPLSGIRCCWYHYVVKERRGSGKNTKWVTITDEKRKQPFYCKDDEGQVRVFPGQAEVITEHRSHKQEGKLRYTETRLESGDELYVLGKAKLDRTQGDRLVLGHEKGTPFIIANIPEAEVMFRKATNGFMWLSLGVSVLFLSAIWVGGANGQFSSLDFVSSALIAPVFLCLIVIALMYNDLVFLRQRCDRNWANIQVSLKKRADLIPNLLTAVKQYLAHEQGLQEALVQLRTQQTTTASGVDAYLAREHAAIDLFSARLEAYPELKGSGPVADFHRRLIRLENEIALMRAGFNDAATQYRTRLETFPDNLVARLGGFQPLDLLRFNAESHAIPSASFAASERDQ